MLDVAVLPVPLSLPFFRLDFHIVGLMVVVACEMGHPRGPVAELDEAPKLLSFRLLKRLWNIQIEGSRVSLMGYSEVYRVRAFSNTSANAALFSRVRAA